MTSTGSPMRPVDLDRPDQVPRRATYEAAHPDVAHFMPDDGDRAREIMNAFFAPAGEDVGQGSCAPVVPWGTS